MDLSSTEEMLLAQCLETFQDFDGIRNNCGNPWVKCLERLGVVNADDKARVLPYDVYRIISSSPRAVGTTSYPGRRPPIGAR